MSRRYPRYDEADWVLVLQDLAFYLKHETCWQDIDPTQVQPVYASYPMSKSQRLTWNRVAMDLMHCAPTTFVSTAMKKRKLLARQIATNCPTDEDNDTKPAYLIEEATTMTAGADDESLFADLFNALIQYPPYYGMDSPA
ncbi:hypothetical protein M409DRAFT_61769 [Zasmidium cellare ATCC 36951]|uniref:Uncharacterized protein n=1 Tax=Zasmidium cellare ATCC 36951 TaxID=1080233 RepID=A0A6A6BUE3_ZASCE|nr:uncharacterized protein M409DRAFT_61769 [Zasmidium cellare ATCC 36951]KAF2158315.1 hypothetical protein M409DRAFT_61769 [Zasmidium cellare ATCC 36951]